MKLPRREIVMDMNIAIMTDRKYPKKTFKIKVNKSETVSSLKRKVSEAYPGAYPIDQQRVFYAGQELADDTKLGCTFIPETTLAIMISKKISAPDTLQLDTDTQTAMDNLEANITKLVQCGFTVDTSVSALTKTGNDLTRAVELLFKPYKKQKPSSDGAVESDGMADQTSAVDGVTTVTQHVDDVIVSGSESTTDHDNDVIMSECPAQINDVITPENAQVDPAPAIASTPSPSASRDIAPAPRGYVYVTPKEKKQVEKLMKLGYTESECLQAFFAFDKDADAAAEFLRKN